MECLEIITTLDVDAIVNAANPAKQKKGHSPLI